MPSSCKSVAVYAVQFWCSVNKSQSGREFIDNISKTLHNSKTMINITCACRHVCPECVTMVMYVL